MVAIFSSMDLTQLDTTFLMRHYLGGLSIFFGQL